MTYGTLQSENVINIKTPSRGELNEKLLGNDNYHYELNLKKDYYY